MQTQFKPPHQRFITRLIFLLILGVPLLVPIPPYSQNFTSLSQQPSDDQTSVPIFNPLRTPFPDSSENPLLQPDATSPPFLLGELLVVYGDYVNESGQEPVEIWTNLLEGMGFHTNAIHVADLGNMSGFDLIVVTPSVGTSSTGFGVSLSQARHFILSPVPVLLLGYSHEVIDQILGFNPQTDFIPCIENQLWSPNEALQIFSRPHPIPHTTNRFSLYSDHILYDAYRTTSLPEKAETLGTNAPANGAQLLWFRAVTTNSHFYYWGLDQTSHLNPRGVDFFENLIHWLIRIPFQVRLGTILAGLQLVPPLSGDYWAVQGAGGFGYPLEPSLRFTWYVTDVVTTHNLTVNISPFKSWLTGTYNSSQGCFEDLASPQFQDRCLTTSMTVLTVNTLGFLGELDVQPIGDYIASCQDPLSGGFFSEQGSSQSNLITTRYAIEALTCLGQLTKIDINAVLSFVGSCQETNPTSSEYGGFYSSSTGESVASLVYTLDALTILNHLTAIRTINQTAILEFIMACEDPSGSNVFDTRLTMDSEEWVLGTSCALQLLGILDALDLIDVATSQDFIIASQFPNGGWGRGDATHDFHNSPDETWYAIQALALTGGLTSIQDTLTGYLIQCCTGWGGATEPIIFGDFLSSSHIVSALNQVEALSAMNLTAFLDYVDNCWFAPQSSFRAHQLPPGVGTDTDTPPPDRTTLESGTFGPLYHYMYAQLLEMINLTGNPWIERSILIRQEIEASQSFAAGYHGMFGLHHLYVGRESDYTFRFDTTCWSLLAHAALGGQPTDLTDPTAALTYLHSCIQGNSTHQFFHDSIHSIPLPDPWRFAAGQLAETWFGLQAWAYLDPSLTGLNGQALATYASHYLQNNTSLVTAYYATEILFFLTTTGLYPEALNLLDREELGEYLLNCFTYSGLIEDISLPNGKWTPYLLDLALQLVNRLDLLPRLDVNPILELTEFTYPQGALQIGMNITFSSTVNESRWGILPSDIIISIKIFNTTYSNSTSTTNPRLWELQKVIPSILSALGPQNLTIIALAPGAIPYYGEILEICEVWGNLTLDAMYLPNLLVPRSIPLNVSIQVGLEGASSGDGQITNGEVLITLESPPQHYIAAHHGQGLYEVQLPTQDLEPQVYILYVNASAPYCMNSSMTELLTIIVFDTSLTVEQVIPSTPVLYEALTLAIGLWNESGTPLPEYNIEFNIIRPGDTLPYRVIHSMTNETGVATCSWIPNEVGQWRIAYSFTGQHMYCSSNGDFTIGVNLRPLSCTILTLPPSDFIDNYSVIELELTDAKNGSSLQGILVSLYKDTELLSTSFTDENGYANCQWLVTAPIGYQSLRLEVTETETYDRWESSNILFLIRDTVTLATITNTTTLYLGEGVGLKLSIVATHSELPNGTASIYWDGIWHHDVTISIGRGSTSLIVSYADSPGDHVIVVKFGHLEVPDVYNEAHYTCLVSVLPVQILNLIIDVEPSEVHDYFQTPTLNIELYLSYLNGTQSIGFSANLTLELIQQNSSQLLLISFTTDENGRSQLSIPTPLPGTYLLVVKFEGQRGYAPCLHTKSLLVHYPSIQLGELFSPIFIVSLLIVIIGVLGGIFGFIRLQNRLKRFTQLFPTNQTPTTVDIHSLVNQSSVDTAVEETGE